MRCLLRGLIFTASNELPNIYKSTDQKGVVDVCTRGNLRATLGKLFNKKPAAENPQSMPGGKRKLGKLNFL